jgi:hypothetical protein
MTGVQSLHLNTIRSLESLWIDSLQVGYDVGTGMTLEEEEKDEEEEEEATTASLQISNCSRFIIMFPSNWKM